MLNGQDDYLIVNIIENFLGSPRSGKNVVGKSQFEFNCPSKTCRRDHDKFNLAYQAKSKVFKCWKCKYSGYIEKLVRDHGSREDLKRLKLVLPKNTNHAFDVFKKPEIDYELVHCELPMGYLPLSKTSSSKLYKLAWDYVTKKRKITPAQIDKYKIGYAEMGPRKNRIILPSFNSLGRINYFEARAFLDDAKIPYFKPDSPDKSDIIFNEHLINWDLPVYLVEGVFDALRIPNAIAMLGKIPSDLLINKLIKNSSVVIVCLDADALRDGVEIYERLTSLGLNVFFIDLKGKKDVSKIFEDDGQEAVNELLKTACRVDEFFKINKLLNE